MQPPDRAQPKHDLGTTIRVIREATGLSLRECAGLADVHYSYLSRLEKGENTHPAPDILQRLADVLNIDASILLSFIGIRPPDTLPPPRVYFRRKLGVNTDEADVLAKLIEDYQAKREEGTNDNTNQSSDAEPD